MQGYRGGNRLLSITYLIGLWLVCLSASTWAQRLPDKPSLTWYVPKAPVYRGIVGNSQLVEYTSYSDLAEKLVGRAGKPYHLSLELTKTKAVDWQILRTIPPASSLIIELADSVMTDSLLPILATWPALEKISLNANPLAGRSFKFAPDGKGGYTVIGGTENIRPRIALTGWEKLRALSEVTLSGDIDLEQTLIALKTAPALESLYLQLFVGADNQRTATALGNLKSLKRLMMTGLPQNFAQAAKGMQNLTSLTIFSPAIDELNAGLTYLTGLQHLYITAFNQADKLQKLRLRQLVNLQTLLIQGRSPSAISLDSVLAGLTSLKSLTIDQTKLRSFPSCVLANKGLVSLSMADDSLTTLPEKLDQLTALESLTLDNNPLHLLPESLCRLIRLKKLSLSRCELETLPATIGQLTSLTSLALNTNQLKSLPGEVSQLTELRQLNVSMNELTVLPVELALLPHLETVAAFWNKIAVFPVGLTRLRELYLTDNQLTEMPPSLGNMTRLRVLLIDNNLINALPEQIGKLDSLETLVIGGNRLTALPNAIGSLRRLGQLALGLNQVRELPETIGGLTSLTSVSLSDNPIARLPAAIGNWTKVKTVTFRLPQLEALPEQIGRWQALENLTVESDRLLVLPNELTECNQLTYLTLTGKRLIGLPEALNKLPYLADISLDGRADSLTGQGRGQIIALPASLATCKALTRLAVLNQQQFDGVEGMQVATALPGLKHLSFINCGITELTGIPWKSLTVSTLNLSQNRISQLTAAVLDMPNLEQVNLSDTNLPAHLNRFFLRRSELAEALKTEPAR